MSKPLSRRAVLSGAVAALALGIEWRTAAAQTASLPFDRWVETFRKRAHARGISDATYTRVMGSLKPDTSVYALDRAQPEFKEPVWQYINRRVSDWRIVIGKARVVEHAALLERIEQTYGIDRSVMLGLWGMESTFGEVLVDPKYMRPIFPALAALAWGEPRRRVYWEQELLNALVIVERGWADPKDMMGSWAGAMGHTQWMPEVWLNIGVDFNGDGRVSPFGLPDDAFAGTAQYLLKRGKYRRGEGWGYEVRLPAGMTAAASGMQPIAAWQDRGLRRANGKPFPRPKEQARLWQPVAGGPVFLLTANFNAIKSYNPANSYTLALGHLGDRIMGEEPFVQQFPGGERALTLAEMQELQRRLTAIGLDTGATDGRGTSEMTAAIKSFQRKVGLKHEDGYPGLEVLARLRAVS
jgi:membrane-bound lytic murein transglycosylase B